MTAFENLGISDDILQSILKMGIKNPTRVQSASIPLLLKGHDVLAQARTGTGKTLAFLIPGIQKLDASKKYVQLLVTTPTRELAVQIANEAKKIISNDDIKVVSVVGGRDFYDQKNKLSYSAQVVVGTPGRILDHVRKQTLMLSGVNYLVFDEIDEMVQRGFLEDVAEISTLVALKCQRFVCSATLSQETASLVKKLMVAPKSVNIDADSFSNSKIDQYIIKVSNEKREIALYEIIKQTNPYLAIVFCSSKESAVEINDWLQSKDVLCDVIQGDMSQTKRLQVMRKFRQAKIQILVATDLAARGLDVEGVTHVINFELPRDAQQYIHRVGRTARAFSSGVAISFYTPEEERKLSTLEKKLNLTFKAKNIAGDDIVRRERKRVNFNKSIKTKLSKNRKTMGKKRYK